MSQSAPKDDKLYLIHINECIDKIDEYVEGEPQVILEDEMVLDAVLRNLQILAESTQMLSDEIKVQFPETDWSGIAGFRNQLVHNYLGVDAGTVVQVIRYDLPKLQLVVQSALAKLDGTEYS